MKLKLTALFVLAAFCFEGAFAAGLMQSQTPQASKPQNIRNTYTYNSKKARENYQKQYDYYLYGTRDEKLIKKYKSRKKSKKGER